MIRRILRCRSTVLRYSSLLLFLSLALSATYVESGSMLESNVGTPTQRLMEKTNELDEEHILKEKEISELRGLLTYDGYRALDFNADDIAARLYMIATVSPGKLANVLSYHNVGASRSYLDCLQALEGIIKLRLDYIESAADVENGVAEMDHRVLNTELSSKEGSKMARSSQRLLFVLSLQQHALKGVQWKDTYYGKIESKLGVQRNELEETFGSIRGADFESSLASAIILNWPAWSDTLTCRNSQLLKPSGPQPEQIPSLIWTSPDVVPKTESIDDVSSSTVEPQQREKTVLMPNAPKKPHRKVPSQQWLQTR